MIAPMVGWSFATIAAYFAARWLYDRVRFPLLHPMIVGIVVLATAIESLGRTYGEYREATGWIVWLAGPAVVAMAVPVYRLRTLLRSRAPIVITVIASGLVFGFTTMTWAFGLLGQPREVQLAGPMHAITGPVAIPIARQIGARQDAMVIGILTAGLIGATVGPYLLRRIGIADRRARGLALGCGSHAIGVARALEVDSVCGAFATVGMMGNAILGAIIFPYLARWLIG